MNILTDKLPRTVNVNGAEIPINTDFRIFIQFEIIIQSDISDKDKIRKALELCYKKIPSDISKAIDCIIDFYAKADEQTEINSSKAKKHKSEPVYSFKYDADYIYSAFLQAYNIDLTAVKMHWWKFRALFRALPDSCEIVKIMGYRAMPITSDMSKKQQEHYRKLQKIYALPRLENEKKMQNEFEQTLLNSGDVSKLIKKYKG